MRLMDQMPKLGIVRRVGAPFLKIFKAALRTDLHDQQYDESLVCHR